MEYTVYTDGSCRSDRKKAASSYVIRTNDLYIHSDVHSFTTVYILEAELSAISSAVTYLVKNKRLNKGDVVTVCVDSIEAIKHCKDVMNNVWTRSTSVSRELTVSLNKFKLTGATIRFKKVHAHKTVMNSNKFVDRLAKCGIKHFDICMR